jgi:two-component system, NarL family, captular synthesis response regulator RcsB
MFKKVLIAEDHESANLSVQSTLKEAGIPEPDYAYYCDDALAKIKKGNEAGQPYDLLITDLYFDEDHRKQQIIGGDALIAAARKIQPELRVLVFSAEGKVTIVDTLFKIYEIDGYVRKARNDAKDLKTAIDQIDKGQRYIPWWFINQMKSKNSYELSSWDIAVISLLAQGIRQKEMPAHLRQSKIYPPGASSIEKGLKKIKEALNFSSNEQLIAYCKDMGIV